MTNAANIAEQPQLGGSLTTDSRYRLSLDDFPIPKDVQAADDWPETLKELALWIGAYDTLRLCEALNGREIYISRKLDQQSLSAVLSADKVAILARVYGGSRFAVPTAHRQIRKARRAAILASVRAGMMTGAVGAQLLGTSRTHMAHIVNQTDEGIAAAPAVIPKPKAFQLLKQAADTVAMTMAAAGVALPIVGNAWAAVMSVWGNPADLEGIAPVDGDTLMGGNAAGDSPPEPSEPVTSDPILASFLAPVGGSDAG